MTNQERLALLSFGCRGLASIDNELWSRTLTAASLIAEEQETIPPLGWIADMLTLSEAELPRMKATRAQPNVLTPGLRRQYEDLLFSRFVHDPAVQRAMRAIRAYADDDLTRATASLIEIMAENIGDTSSGFGPTTVRRLQRNSGPTDQMLSLKATDDLELAECRKRFQEFLNSLHANRSPISSLQIRQLEAGLATAGFSLRLLIQDASRCISLLESEVSKYLIAHRDSMQFQRSNDKKHHHTELLTGGYHSIGTRGRIESLLESELAFASEDPEDRPDLFDARIVRGDALYFVRDDSAVSRPPASILIEWDATVAELAKRPARTSFSPSVELISLTAFVARRLYPRERNGSEAPLQIRIPQSLSRKLADEKSAVELLLRDLRDREAVVLQETSTAADQHQRQQFTTVRIRGDAAAESDTTQDAELTVMMLEDGYRVCSSLDDSGDRTSTVSSITEIAAEVLIAAGASST